MEIVPPKSCCNWNWRLVAKVLGCMWVAMGLIGILYQIYTHKITPWHLVTFVFAMTTAMFWLFGLATNKTILMLFSLILTGIQTVICLFMVITLGIGIISSVSKTEDASEASILNWMLVAVGFATVFVVVNFALAVLCYVEIRADVNRLRNSDPNVSHAA